MEGKFSRRLGGPQGVAKLKRASSLTVNYFNSILLSAFFNSVVFVWFLTFIDTDKFGHERKLWSLREGLSNFHEGMFFMLGDVTFCCPARKAWILKPCQTIVLF